MVLMEVRNLSKAFSIEGGMFRRRVGAVQALRQVSFKLEKGSTLAVVGGSGCGKSTLAKIIAGLLAPDEGSILWQDRPLFLYGPAQRARLIQMIFQDPFASLNPKLSIGTQLAEVLRAAFASSTPQERRQKASGLLSLVGLPGAALECYPFQFSGGQRQRIAIARALAMEPKLLIADEPLSALDVSVQAQILELFESLKTRLQLTTLFITHDLSIAAATADRVLVLKDGQVAEEGAAAETLAHPRNPYTRALMEAVPRLPA